MRERARQGLRRLVLDRGPRGLFLRQFLLGEAVLLVLLASITLFVLARNDAILRDEIGSILEGTVGRTRDSMDAVFEQTDLIAAAISLHADVNTFLGIAAEDAAGLDAQGWIVSRLIGGYALTAPFVSSIYLFSGRSGTIVSANLTVPLARFNDTGWMERYRSAPLNIPTASVRRAVEPYGDVITVLRPIGTVYDPRLDGAVIVNIKAERIREKAGGDGVVGELCILDPEGGVLYCRDRSLLGSRFPLPADAGVLFPSLRDAPKGSYLSRSVLGRGDRTYIMAFPLGQFRRRQASSLSIGLILAGVSIPLSLAASMLLSWASARPFRQLLRLLDRPEPDAVSAAGSEEVRGIAARIVTVIHANRDLHDAMAVQLSLLDRTRNVALQAQINPHFLFNTLETIRWEAVALADGENKVSRMIAGLSRLLRISLETADQVVPLRREIEHARVYVELLRSRYPDSFDVAWDLDEAVLDRGVLKLSLQPLIENAFQHGIKGANRRGTIRVAARVHGDRLRVTVADDGCGIGAEELAALRAGILEASRSLDADHIGVRNVAQRMRLVFGDGCFLAIDGGPGEGTLVSLEFPLTRITPRGR